MQMKKKCAAVLAAAALVLSMAACSESKPAAESSSAASSAPSSSSEASAPEKTEAPKLEDYQKDLNAVMEKLVPDMNEFLTLDQNSDDYLDQVVVILGKVDQAFVDIAALTPPAEIEEKAQIAKDASKKMSEAVSAYSEAAKNGDMESDETVQAMTDAMNLYMEAVTDMQGFAMDIMSYINQRVRPSLKRRTRSRGEIPAAKTGAVPLRFLLCRLKVRLVLPF